LQVKNEIKGLISEIQKLIIEPELLSIGYQKLNINAATKKSLINKLLTPIEKCFLAEDALNTGVAQLKHLVDDMEKVKTNTSSAKGIMTLLPEKWLKKGENLDQCPNLEKVVNKIKHLIQKIDCLTHFFTVAAIRKLRHEVDTFKEKNGLISFNDMLTRVESALYKEPSSLLLRKVREKYQVAFVDEFQDTDPVQWRIFKKIFLKNFNDQSSHLLFLIGDPKQAIYSFRGADVYTYLDARSEMEKRARYNSAKLYALSTNWRSQPQLINVFNHLFSRKEWFLPQDEVQNYDIGYQSAEAPNECKAPMKVVQDDSKRPCFNIIDMTKTGGIKKSKFVLANFIAGEIHHLLKNTQIIIQNDESPERSLNYSDICILIRGKNDIKQLEPVFLKEKIPYSFYKKPGLFNSDEALFLETLFHAILDPSDMTAVKWALLTPFFDIPTDKLHCFESQPQNYAIKVLLRKWNEYASLRKWGRFFRSILEDSGLLLREIGKENWDRSYTNYQQISEYLQIKAWENNLEFEGILSLLQGYRKHTLEKSDEMDIHQIDTEDSKVQIMTMHVSKGLQFPVVFIAGGLTQPSMHLFHEFHEIIENGGNIQTTKVIDLTKRENSDQHHLERENEDKRLFYVALTRARIKLYVPFLPDKRRSAWIGPVSRFLSSSIKELDNEKTCEKKCLWIDPAMHSSKTMEEDKLDKSMDNTYHLGMNWKLTDILSLPKSATFSDRMIQFESFSSLNKKHSYSSVSSSPSYGFHPSFQSGKEEDEFNLVSGEVKENIQKQKETIPGGSDIGSMFHDILEVIDYKTVLEKRDEIKNIHQIHQLVTSKMNQYQVDHKWEKQILNIVVKTLTEPINFEGKELILGGLPKNKRLHEVEFYFPFNTGREKEFKVPGIEIQPEPNGYLRGFIDLVFSFKGKYFLADWKSNILEKGYQQKSLGEAMETAGYDLQYKLYVIALIRWLRTRLNDNFDIKKHFGGVFYFFLRGMGKGDGKGIYYVPLHEIPSEEELELELAETLAEV